MPQRATRPVLASLSCVLLVLGGCLRALAKSTV